MFSPDRPLGVGSCLSSISARYGACGAWALSFNLHRPGISDEPTDRRLDFATTFWRMSGILTAGCTMAGPYRLAFHARARLYAAAFFGKVCAKSADQNHRVRYPYPDRDRSIMWRQIAVLLVALSSLTALAGCVHSPPTDPWDPIEPMNRAIYSFNRTLDDYVLRPVAEGYHTITPDPVEAGVGNFFDNAAAPVTIVNSVLQLEWKSFNLALGRFLINSTVGIFGLIDVASAINIKDPNEDLGQTLGYWGLGRGPYLVLPLFGPSSGRATVGMIGDYFLNPLSYINSYAIQLSLLALYAVDTRVSFLAFDQVLAQQFDPYIFMRTYYLKSRRAAVHDNLSGPQWRSSGDVAVVQ